MLHNALYAEVSAYEDINIEYVFQEQLQYVYDLQKEAIKLMHRSGKIDASKIISN